MRLLLLALLAACSGPAADDGGKDTSEADADTDTDADTDADTDTDTEASADADGDGALPSIDCDDTNPAVFPGAAEQCNEIDDDCDGEIDEGVATTKYLDGDGDGYGDPATALTACEHDDIYIGGGTDCDDDDADVHPGAAEPDCADPTDYDCDGDVAYADADGDGAAACEDCDDDDDAAFPGASEACDGVDNDCDGTADEEVTSTFYGDADADGYGGSRFVTDACDAPAGYLADGSDCDDLDDAAYPGASERCDGDDDDCDGTADDDAIDAATWYLDDDGDGQGASSVATRSCSAPAGYAAASTDCDDADPDVYTGAPEACDGADHDCDGAVNESDAVDAATWYIDLDADGYGGTSFTTTACTAPSGFLATATDCDDTDGATSPGATETCNGSDDDCDGSTDESGSTGETTWYADADGDGYGDASATRSSCNRPSGYVAVSGDCDDTRSTVSPAGTEACNDRDDDCDGSTDESGATGGTAYYPDDDEDGFGDSTGTTVTACDAPVGYRLDGTDCDDTEITVHPYAYESPSDGVDNDCDGDTDVNDRDTRRTGPSGDNGSTTVSLSTMTFPFCGVEQTTIYMQVNGRVTFGSSDTDATETSAELSSDTMVAGVWDDLRSSTSSTMEWMEQDGAVGFYWVDVPEAVGSAVDTFSIILFDDGRILLDYGALGSTDGLAGWSCAAAVTSEVDLTAGMDALAAGRWGLGNATESNYYEIFNTDNDLDNRVVRLCGNVDDVTDPCAE